MRYQTQSRSVLDTDRVGWLLFQLATPAFFGMFVQTLYNVVNTIFIGHFVENGTLAIAGLSICFPIQMLFMGMGMMIGMGGTSLISRFIGSHERDKAERTLGNGITCIVIIGIVITAITLPNINAFLRLAGASDEVLPLAKEYLVIIISGTLFNITALVLLNFARAEGNARVAMVGNILGAGLNIILDSIFIVAMHMGVTGAALGTVIAQTVTLIYMCYYYLSGNSYLKFRTSNLRLDTKILKPMFAIGASSFVQTVASSFSSLLLIREVIAYGGDVYLSAFGIIQRIMMFAVMPAIVVGQGVQPILGFNYGARRYSLAIKALKISVLSATLLSSLAFIVLYSIPGPVIRIFSTDPQLLDAGIYASRLVFFSMPIIGFVMVGSTSFMSIGKALQAFITAFARPVLFLIPSVIILPRLLGLEGVFLSFPSSDILTLILTILLLIPVIQEFRRAAAEEKLGDVNRYPPEGLLDSIESGRIDK
jgi:putative MATE family efflux protein